MTTPRRASVDDATLGENYGDELVAPRPSRSGTPWSPSEDDELVAGVLSGLTEDALAEAHGRTPGAIAGRLSLMVAGGEDDLVPQTRARRVEWLRHRLAADPAYDWRTPLLAAVGRYQRQWTEAENVAVHNAWEARRDLADLAADLCVQEHFAVRRIIQLGLAPGIVEVTDRLGCTSGSVTAMRRAIALDAARTRVLVLVITVDDEVHHVSVHVRDDDADVARERVVAELRNRGGRREVAWTVAARQVDDGDPAGGKRRSGRVVVHGDLD